MRGVGRGGRGGGSAAQFCAVGERAREAPRAERAAPAAARGAGGGVCVRLWSRPEGRGVARDGDERPPRARPFEHRAQGPMGCVRVGSLARRGARAAAAGRSLGSSSARTGGRSLTVVAA